MQAIIEAKALQTAVKQAAQAAKSKHMPILNGVKLEANGAGLELIGTDLSTWACSTAGGLTQDDVGPDAVLVDAKILAKLCGRLSGEVLLTAEDGAGVLTIGGAQLPTLALDDYPAGPNTGPDRVPVLELTGATFKGLCARMKCAALRCGETTRLALTGVNFAYGEGAVKVCATNGYRLLLEEYVSDSAESGEVLVDAYALAKLAPLVKAKDTVTLEHVKAGEQTPEYMAASFPGAVYYLRTIAEEFPDIDRVMPDTKDAVTLTLNRRRFLDALARASIVSAEDSDAVKLAPNPDSSALYLSSSSKNKGAFREGVRMNSAIQGECEAAAFRCEYLIDTLKTSKAATVDISLQGPLKACRIQLEGEQVEGRTSQAWVVMPVAVKA